MLFSNKEFDGIDFTVAHFTPKTPPIVAKINAVRIIVRFMSSTKAKDQSITLFLINDLKKKVRWSL